MKSMVRILVMIFAVTLLGSACTPHKHAAKVRYGENMILDRGDDEEYEVHILDTGFDRWFATNSKPINFYSPQYYQMMNRRYVMAWNEKVSTHGFRRNSPFEAPINYDPTIDYGVEVDYKLYYYFKYIEDVYGRFM